MSDKLRVPPMRTTEVINSHNFKDDEIARIVAEPHITHRLGMLVFALHAGDVLVAVSAWPRELARYAFANGANEVKHDYDLNTDPDK
jgi:hypothetical protein